MTVTPTASAGPTGPRTPEGKAIASRNAPRHGLLSRMPVLPDEDEQVFVQFRERLLDALSPEGELEVILADRAVVVAWRLQRVPRVEAGMLAWYYFEEVECRARADVQQYEVDPLSTLMERDPIIKNPKGHDAALQALTLEGVVAFAEHVLVNAARLWVEFSLDQKQRLQRVLFPQGVTYEDGEFGTAETSLIFGLLRVVPGANESEASPAGFEPTLPA